MHEQRSNSTCSFKLCNEKPLTETQTFINQVKTNKAMSSKTSGNTLEHWVLTEYLNTLSKTKKQSEVHWIQLFNQHCGV